MSKLGNKQIMARNIQKYMDLHNITRTDLCEALGVKYTTLTDWIKGNTYPRIDWIEKMANYLGIRKSDLVEDSISSDSVGGTFMLSNIGTRIKKLREQTGMSQIDLAIKIEVSKQTLYKYENGIISNIPSDKIERISEVFHVSPAYLMGWESSISTQDISNSNGMHLSVSEKQIITSYRRASPAIQQAVLKLLDIPEEGEISLSS